MIFLFSSFTGLPDRFFSGYAFSDADFVSGLGGAKAFFKDTGRELVAGLDGCYLAIWRDSDGHRIGVDHAGYKKLFFYNDGRIWGFSNSVKLLADHLQSKGVRLHADPVQMRALEIESTLTTQLSSFQTIVSGIVLLPSACEIKVMDNLATLQYRATQATQSYREALEAFLERWISRLETMILESRVQVVCDLTGGRDSRLVFGLLAKAQERLLINDSSNCFVRSGTAERWKKDLVAARRIAEHYNISLNKEVPTPRGLQKFGTLSSYENWKNLNLAAYYPIYFAPTSSSDFVLHLHGGGGENHRPFYPYTTFDQFVEIFSCATTVDPMLDYWIANVGETIRKLKSGAPGTNEWILHYREFRSRLHGGRSPQYRNVLSPLASIEMERLSNFPGKSDDAQAHFDVMASLYPELIHFPYDSPLKAPSSANLEKLTVAQVRADPSPGRCFIELDQSTSCSKDGQESALEMLMSDLNRATTKELYNAIPEVVKKALRTRNAISGKKRFDHASDGKNISRALAAAFALSL